MSRRRLALLAAAAFAAASWMTPPASARPSIGDGVVSGVFGSVTERTGDCMPIRSAERCREHSLGAHSIAVFAPPVQYDKQAWLGAHYFGDRRPILTTQTDTVGRYSFNLPPGEYSVMVRDVADDDVGWYCSSWDLDGRACPVKVTATHRARHDIVVNHASE